MVVVVGESESKGEDDRIHQETSRAQRNNQTPGSTNRRRRWMGGIAISRTAI